MSDNIKIKDKVTGEIITLKLRDSTQVAAPVKTKEPYWKGFENRLGLSNQEVASRGNLFQNIKQNVQSPSPVKRILGGVEAVAAPIQMVESGISNPILAYQSGVNSPFSLMKESIAGFTGKKQGEIGDVLYRAGLPKPMSSAMGLALTIGIPGKAAQYTGKFFNGISKMTDKGILKSGSALVKATQEAKKFTGAKLDEVFMPFNNINVDSKSLLNVLNRLPKTAVAGIEENIGYIKDIIKNPTLSNLRQVKHFLGELRPTAFGKEARGVAETLEGKYINEVYGGIKKLMENTLRDNFGDKTAQALMSAEKAYSSVSKASSYVKKTIVDSTLGLPTKAGEAARKLVTEGDVSFRTALNTLRKSGKTAKKDIDKAVSSLEKFNRWMSLKKSAAMAAKAATYGGAVGALGGAIAGKVMGRNND